MPDNIKQEPVFELIKSMSKAEKRNFKLYATRLDGNQDAKFIKVFDFLDSVAEYDEVAVLASCPITKVQLPNMKAHLYKQILVSIRLLHVQRMPSMQLREQVDFARILYDKGLYRQSYKFLDKAFDQAIEQSQPFTALDIIDFTRQVEKLNMTTEVATRVGYLYSQTEVLGREIIRIGEISDISTQLYKLHQKLGYARTQKDLDLIVLYFGPKLDGYDPAGFSFLERFHYYQARAWYYYIQHDFVNSYRYGRRWVEMFDRNPPLKTQMYDSYLKGYARILEGLYLMRKYRLFSQTLHQFQTECLTMEQLNDNALYLSQQILLTGQINLCFMEGSFAGGVTMVGQIKSFAKKHSRQMGIHNKMLLYYKIACLYFGNQEYTKCMEYLGHIISTKDPNIGRDLQSFARILNLIASYEAGIDYNLDYQIRSVYSFVVKMNDMQEVQREMLTFLKRLGSIYDSDLKTELRTLYERLRVYENHPYLRRAFYYLDILSWLESKLTGRTVAEIISSRRLK